MEKITCCLTSCNRFDLLERTLDSFFKLNTYPVEKFLLTEDSANPDMKNKILQKYGSKVELIFNPVNLGLFKSIDNMYSMVNTDYVFRMEDDWEFISNPNFLQDSLAVLKDPAAGEIGQVWIRKDCPEDWIEKEEKKTSCGVEYKLMKLEHAGNWNGFSLNTSLIRFRDDNKICHAKMFPNGYSEFILPNQKAVFTEHNCMLHTKNFNYRAAILKNRSTIHIGGGRSTIA